MSYSESYDQCMAQKHLPLLGEVFSHKTLSEAFEILDEIDQALEAAGGKEITLAALASAGPAMGLSESALEVVGLLAAGGANLAAHMYVIEAGKCLGFAVVKNSLFSELDALPSGDLKDQVQESVQSDQAVA